MMNIVKICANPVVDYAAEELKKYLRMMMPDCGDVAISYDPMAQDGFRLGLMENFGLDTSEALDLKLDDILHIDTDENGGIIAGFLTAIVVARKKRIRFSVIADIAGPAVMVGQIIGRWGNFVNVEAYGAETTLPWRMGILYSFDDAASFVSEKFVHPTFLYESLWNLVGLILITYLYKKKKFHGQMFLTYMTWYGFGRMLIEGLRTDSLYIGSIRVSQMVGLVTFVVGMILLVWNFRKAKMRASLADDASTPDEEDREVKIDGSNH